MGRTEQFRQNRTSRRGQAETDRQNRTGRTGRAEQDKQNRKSRMGHLKRNRQNRTAPQRLSETFNKPAEQHLPETWKAANKFLKNYPKKVIFIKWNRRARPGQPEQDRKTATRIGQPLQKRWNKTFRTGLHGQDYQDGTARTGLPGQNCQDRTARTGLPGQDCQNMGTRRLPARDC
jgi:hypothetical protein